MSNVDIFKNSTKTLPERDSQIVRVDLDKSDIGGRKSHLPSQDKSEAMAISHVPSAGGSK